MSDAGRSEIVTRCVDEILAGRATLEECIAMYPALCEELTISLTVVRLLGRERGAISPGFKRALRDRLLTEAQPVTVSRFSSGKVLLEWLSSSRFVLGMRVSSAVVVIVLLLTGGGVSVVYASQNSLPGEFLYPVKIGTENMRLAVAPTSESRVNLNLSLAERRVQEVVSQTARGKEVNEAVPQAVGKRLDAAIEEMKELGGERSRPLISRLSQSTINQQAVLNQALSGLSDKAQKVLEESIDASRRGSTVAVIASGNPSFLASSPSVANDKLEQGHFRVAGVLQSAATDSWNVGGVNLTNVEVPDDATYSVGKWTVIEGLVSRGRTFVSRIGEGPGQSGNESTIEGVFTGASEDGKTWYVGGIPVVTAENVTAIAGGTVVRLRGSQQNDSFVATGVEIRGNQRDVNVTGRLISVSEDSRRVVIEVAGAKIEANLADTDRKDNDEADQEMSVLRSQTGKDVTISGLKSKGGVLYGDKVSPRDNGQGERGRPRSGESREGSSSEAGSGDSIGAGDEGKNGSGSGRDDSDGDSQKSKNPTGAGKQTSEKSTERKKTGD